MLRVWMQPVLGRDGPVPPSPPPELRGADGFTPRDLAESGGAVLVLGGGRGPKSRMAT